MRAEVIEAITSLIVMALSLVVLGFVVWEVFIAKRIESRKARKHREEMRKKREEHYAKFVWEPVVLSSTVFHNDEDPHGKCKVCGTEPVEWADCTTLGDGGYRRYLPIWSTRKAYHAHELAERAIQQ